MKNIILSVAVSGISGVALAQWNPNPTVNTPVCAQANDQLDPRIVTDSKGGAITTWLDYRNDANQLLGDIFVQRSDKNGMNKWTVNGVALCTDASNQSAPSIVEDGNGGAIIAWNDWRNGNRDIYAQKIDSLGVVQWTANGVAVVAKASQQQDAKLIADGTGGAIIVWQDSVNGLWDVYAQRISSVGALSWTANGVSVCSSPDAQINPRIETDGSGGAVIVWQDKRNALDYNIYAQRVDATGATIWFSNGVLVCNSTGTQSNPKIEPDGSGGVIIAWQDKRNGLDYNVYAQRLNSAGAIQWATNGVAICTSAGSQSAVDMTSEGVGGAVIVWKDQRIASYEIYTQKIDLAGAVQWTVNGILISNAAGDQLNPNVVGDGSGGAIIVWQDSSLNTSDITSQRVDAGGNIMWTAGGVVVGAATDAQTSPKNVSDGAGGCIYVWEDKRNTTDQDIYAHHLYSGGTASGIHEQNSDVESSVYPNPFSNSALIEIHSPNMVSVSGLNLVLFDVVGKEVKVSFKVTDNGIQISRGEMQDGIYFYEIRSNQNLLSQGKLIVTTKY